MKKRDDNFDRHTDIQTDRQTDRQGIHFPQGREEIGITTGSGTETETSATDSDL